MAKKVYILMTDDGKDKGTVAVFRKKPSDKKLAALELYEGLDSIEAVKDAFGEHLFWETAHLY